MKFKTGDEARVKRTNKETMYKHIEGTTVLILNNVCGDLYKVYDCIGGQWVLDEEMLEPIVPTLSEVKDGKIDCIVHTQTQEEANILYEELGSDSGWHRPANECWQYHNKDTWYIIQNGLVHQFGDEDCRLAYPFMPTCEFSDLFATGGMVDWSKLVFKNGSSIEALPLDDAVRGKNHFCTGFRGGKISVVNDLIVPRAEMERAMDKLLKALENPSVKFGIKNFEQKLKEEEKMSTKFTFYTEEGYRIDKSNNSKVETITTFVKINGFDNTYLGMATCDKTDYSERDGILNAIANAVLGGNFDREYEKFLADKKRKYDESCKCKICGRNYYEDEKTGKRTPFTPEDARKHEEWHEQNKKNKRERYLLRKRAKEIAFEEQAQKMAKEMIDAEKGAK